jgi:hypothetical protein
MDVKERISNVSIIVSMAIMIIIYPVTMLMCIIMKFFKKNI